MTFQIRLRSSRRPAGWKDVITVLIITIRSLDLNCNSVSLWDKFLILSSSSKSNCITDFTRLSNQHFHSNANQYIYVRKRTTVKSKASYGCFHGWFFSGSEEVLIFFSMCLCFLHNLTKGKRTNSIIHNKKLCLV